MTSEERRAARRERREQKRNKPEPRYEDVFSYNNLYNAYKKCRRGVSWKGSVQSFITRAPSRIANLHRRLMNGQFKSRGFYEFDLNERGKIRHIKSVDFEERIVQRCLCDNLLVPVMTRNLIYDNSASQKGKGYHFAVKRLERHLRDHIRQYGEEGYILIYDYHAFFDSIDHDVCKRMLRERVADDRLYALCCHFIDVFGDVGLGLGSQISQVMAICYTDEIDKHIRAVTARSARYMDDGYAISPDLRALQETMSWLAGSSKKLGLRLNAGKTRILKIRHGFTFLKARISIHGGIIVKRICKTSVARTRRRLKKLNQKVSRGADPDMLRMSYASWEGYARHFRARRTIHTMEQYYNSLYQNAIARRIDKLNYMS
jgi:hypothetical protein